MSEHEGRVTTDLDEIRAWAQRHDAVPATARGTEDASGAGVLTLDLVGHGAGQEDLEHVDWDTWGRKFEESDLAFLYQDEKKSGEESTFFRLVDRNREDV